jgi:hypothetical protein
MLHPDCFQRPWLEAKRDEMGAQDLAILEHTVYAFALLHHLVESGLDFVFKGGTSILLLLPTPRRLSIDIDINIAESHERFMQRLRGIGRKAPFTGLVTDPKRPEDPPLRSFHYFRYHSPLGGEQTIKLDVVEEACPLTGIQLVGATPNFLVPQNSIRVKIPTIEAILGDKLTAVGPRTVGVPFRRGERGMEGQIVKQLFDIRQLHLASHDPTSVRDAYLQTMAAQIRFRGGRMTIRQCAEDAIDFCKAGQSLAFKKPHHDDAALILKGQGTFGNNLIGAIRYTNPELQAALAVTAALVSWASHSRAASLSAPIHLPADELEALKGTSIQCPDPDSFIRLNAEANAYWAWIERFG